MDILRVENLCKTYGAGANRVQALDSVSFSVPKGQFVAVVGASGSGKSTLMHILGGIEKPTSGKVFIGEQDLYEKSEEQLAIFRRRQIGLIYQFFSLIPVLTVKENIALPVLLDSRRVNEDRLSALLDSLELTGMENRLPQELSGGQQQRVSVARALINAPALVLADEPTGNLDSKNTAQLTELLRTSVRTYSQTLIVITHDENLALKADRIIALSDGRITADSLHSSGR